MPYIRLDHRILTSSLWFDQPSDVLRIWLFLLIKADARGIVDVTVPAIAHLNLLTTERAEEVLAILAAPDRHSRTPDNDGRRIEIRRSPQFQIVVLNYKAYREKDYTNRDRQRRFRERQAVTPLRNGATPLVTHVSVDVTEEEETTTKTKTKAGGKRASREAFKRPTLEDVRGYIAEKGYTVTAERWFAHYESNGWMVGKVAMKDWRAAVRTWAVNDLDKGRGRRRNPKLSSEGSSHARDRATAESGVCPRCGGPNPEKWTVCKVCLADMGALEPEASNAKE